MTNYYKKKYKVWENCTDRQTNLKKQIYRKRLSEFFDFLKNKRKEGLKGKTALDIGCGLGEVMDILKENGFEVDGVELNDYARKQVKKRGLKVYENLKYVRGKYDLIILFEVLEHIENTTKFLKTIRKHLKPNGIFVISVPNVNSLTFKLLGKKHNSYHENHLHYFNQRSLRFELMTNGFNIMKIYTEQFKIFEFYKALVGISNKKNKKKYKDKKYENLKSSTLSRIYYKYFFWFLSSIARTLGLGEKVVIYSEK